MHATIIPAQNVELRMYFVLNGAILLVAMMGYGYITELRYVQKVNIELSEKNWWKRFKEALDF